MRVIVYLIGIATIFDGVLHLLFPDRWDALLVSETRRVLPSVGKQFEQWYYKYPLKRRLQGLGWIAIGATILWMAGSPERHKE